MIKKRKIQDQNDEIFEEKNALENAMVYVQPNNNDQEDYVEDPNKEGDNLSIEGDGYYDEIDSA